MIYTHLFVIVKNFGLSQAFVSLLSPESKTTLYSLNTRDTPSIPCCITHAALRERIWRARVTKVREIRQTVAKRKDAARMTVTWWESFLTEESEFGIKDLKTVAVFLACTSHNKQSIPTIACEERMRNSDTPSSARNATPKVRAICWGEGSNKLLIFFF